MWERRTLGCRNEPAGIAGEVVEWRSGRLVGGRIGSAALDASRGRFKLERVFLVCVVHGVVWLCGLRSFRLSGPHAVRAETLFEFGLAAAITAVGAGLDAATADPVLAEGAAFQAAPAPRAVTVFAAPDALLAEVVVAELAPTDVVRGAPVAAVLTAATLPVGKLDIRRASVVGVQHGPHEREEVAQASVLESLGDGMLRLSGAKPGLTDMGMGNIVVVGGGVGYLVDSGTGAGFDYPAAATVVLNSPCFAKP